MQGVSLLVGLIQLAAGSVRAGVSSTCVPARVSANAAAVRALNGGYTAGGGVEEEERSEREREECASETEREAAEGDYTR